MADTNFVILIGRLTRDAERRASNGPLNFAIAVNRRVKQGESWVEEAEFFDIVYWHKSLDTYLVKGKQVAIEGELHQHKWEQDGQSRSKIQITANNVQLLGGGQTGQGARNTGDPRDDPGHVQDHAQKPYSPRSAGSGSTGGDGMPPDFPDDIPF